MTQPAKAQEPSMEEILASIRRIIADDDAAKSASNPPTQPPAVSPLPPPPTPVPPPRPAAAAPARPASPPAMAQEEIDALMAPAAARQAPERPAAGVLDLTEAMTAPAPSEGFRTIDGQSDIMFEEESEEIPPRAVDSRPPAPASDERPLISNSTTVAIDSAFNTLAQSVLVQNARTLEDLVREMLRPLLKTWLDDNLPGLVERLVRAEIERVSRGRV